MRIHSGISIDNKNYAKGDNVPWHKIYPFFLFHMLMFGGSGFLMAYGSKDVSALMLYLHGGFAVSIYLVFYLAIFGRDEVKWMFINGALGLLGIWSQIDWILSLFGRNIGDYPKYIHVIPFLYYILYTFLIRNAILDLAKAREDERRRRFVDNAYIVGSLTVYAVSYFLRK